ncbi:hypothetical protein CXG81DRAFT_28171 [Caulochytrium protostelioides]|uniref:MYND-type domain-containing protein n=1 Tax=Caulochytrium protostelioides TaxID=1555241 RepID=A0A4P9WZN3_9FUNG|nr:hypothetical protein CXG81DRAFT_28171 [Caulochytrium protostelioides]|eukprot:RKO99049.1 hypothetical protein CXG81DRAFT_28171 [Caulochytrium protostelioides]
MTADLLAPPWRAPATAPLQIATVPGKGRAFVARTDLAAGEIVQRCRAYGAIVDSQSLRRVCAHCFALPASPDAACRPLPVACRADCGVAFYCSAACEAGAWPRHRLIDCALARRFFPDAATRPAVPLLPDGRLPPWQADHPGPRNDRDWDAYTVDMIRLVMDLLVCQLKENSGAMVDGGQGRSGHGNGGHENGALDPPEQPRFCDVWNLCANTDNFSAARRHQFAEIAAALAPLVVAMYADAPWSIERAALVQLRAPEAVAHAATRSEVTADDRAAAWAAGIQQLILREECNSFGLYTFHLKGPTAPRQGYAVAVYPHAVFYNHLCRPNVGHLPIPQGPTAETATAAGPPDMVFYTTMPLAAGEEACIAYMEPMSDHRQRRALLKDVFLFECRCSVCEQSDCAAQADTADVTAPRPDFRRDLCPVTACQGRLVPCGLIQLHSKAAAVSPSRLVCEACGTRLSL